VGKKWKGRGYRLGVGSGCDAPKLHARNSTLNQYIKIPLALPGWAVVEQHKEGSTVVVEVASTAASAVCPYCGTVSSKVHDRRAQRKRDVPLGEWAVAVVMRRRRFRCRWCRTAPGRPRTFSEPVEGFGQGPKGRVRRTTGRLRQQLAEQARRQTVKRVAQDYGVGQSSVTALPASVECLKCWMDGTKPLCGRIWKGWRTPTEWQRWRWT
jgi:hypothetical protein